MPRAGIALLMAGVIGSAHAGPDAAALEARLARLAEELRCLVCQNQSLADSQSELALDLKQQVREQLAQGRSDAQVRDYLAQRYGDFVLYRPPLRPSTGLLWAAPLLLVLAGLALLARRWRRAQDLPDEPAAAFSDAGDAGDAAATGTPPTPERAGP